MFKEDRIEQSMGPFVIVIFGATGDLAQKKLLPALFSLYKQGALGKEFFIVGFARRLLTDEEYRKMLEESLGHHNDVWQEFIKNIYYQQGLFDEQQGYDGLVNRLRAIDKEAGKHVARLYYLATPPDNYETILSFFRKTNFTSSPDSKIIVEKPFGRDLETAKELDKKLANMFEERQIFRVDHYLGKETVQNMIVFRFANSIFEPVWNREHIDHVQITLSEKEGVRSRGKFFDGVGQLRDMGQNHLLQLLATVAMEQPRSFERESVRDVRVAAIKDIKPLSPHEISESVVRGQYEGYTKEKDVAAHSETETYVAMKLHVNSPRFEGVPFYLRAGKKMAEEVVDIKIVFKQTCHILFKEAGCPEIGNVLTIRIQPDEGISMRFIVKEPGSKLALSPVTMNFSYEQTFGSQGMDAYEKILLDILAGDQMLFNRSDELDSSWHLISTILTTWEKEGQKVLTYKEDTWGPEQANKLIEKDGRKWL